MLLSRKIILAVSFLYCSITCATTSQLAYQQRERINNPHNNSNANNWFSIKISSESPGKTIDKVFDFDLRFSKGEEDLQFSVPQAYLELKGKTYSLSLGRKILDWSPNEGTWGLSYLNVHQGIDFLGFKEEGVSALHFKKYFGGFSLGGFLSYFHVPQTNPGFYINDGEIKPRSEWSRTPQESALLQGEVVPMYYDVQLPALGEFLFHESYGTELAYNWNSGKVSLFGAYKPENGIRVRAQAKYEQIEKEQIHVTAVPFVNHQWVYGGNISQKAFGLDFNFGVEVTDPKNHDAVGFETDETSFLPQYLKRSYFMGSMGIDRDFFSLSLNYIQLIEGAGGADDYFSIDTKWSEAIGLNWSYIFSDSFRYKGSHKYDIKKDDQILTSEIAYDFNPNVTISLGFEFLIAESKTSYWFPYRANDTVYSSLSYIF